MAHEKVAALHHCHTVVEVVEGVVILVVEMGHLLQKLEKVSFLDAELLDEVQL